MTRPVKITTPIPTLDEFGERLGLSKAKRKSLGPIFIERRPQGDYVVRRTGAGKAIKVLPTQKEAVERAREVSPNGTILVERVRSSTRGALDKWRKA
jgi:hypothetical protein